MWRGEKEFHLVAGGEELFQEDGLLASPKASVSPDPPESPISRLELRDDLSSSSSSTPEAVPVEYTSRMSATIPIAHNSSRGNMPRRVSESQSNISFPSSSFDLSVGAPSSMPSLSPLQSGFHPETMQMHHGSALFSLPPSQGSYLDGTDLLPAIPVPTTTNRILSLNLWAEGMSPFEVDVERLSVSFFVSKSPSRPLTTFTVLLIFMGSKRGSLFRKGGRLKQNV